MARRVPLTAVNDAINCLEEDGGVILSNFASEEDVKAVNDDACPYIDAIAKKVGCSSNAFVLDPLIVPA